MQFRLSANGPSIIKGHALADARLSALKKEGCCWLSDQLIPLASKATMCYLQNMSKDKQNKNMQLALLELLKIFL